MKNALILFVLAALTFSCKQKDESKVVEKELSTAEKIANANGIQNWKKVSELQFTFNVDKDSSHFQRSWIWKPKTDDIIMISGKDTVSYNRKSMDSIATNADKALINDKYWLLAPFHLIWDTTATISETSLAEAPISKKQLNKITITYPNSGGYTPGDAYDLFFGDDFMIEEWNYRKGNANVPTMSTTWEDYEDFKGIQIAKTHKRADANWKLYFTQIKVTD